MIDRNDGGQGFAFQFTLNCFAEDIPRTACAFVKDKTIFGKEGGSCVEKVQKVLALLHHARLSNEDVTFSGSNL